MVVEQTTRPPRRIRGAGERPDLRAGVPRFILVLIGANPGSNMKRNGFIERFALRMGVKNWHGSKVVLVWVAALVVPFGLGLVLTRLIIGALGGFDVVAASGETLLEMWEANRDSFSAVGPVIAMVWVIGIRFAYVCTRQWFSSKREPPTG